MADNDLPQKKGDEVSACPHAMAANRYGESREILQGVLTQRQIPSYDKRLTKKPVNLKGKVIIFNSITKQHARKTNECDGQSRENINKRMQLMSETQYCSSWRNTTAQLFLRLAVFVQTKTTYRISSNNRLRRWKPKLVKISRSLPK